ncbi:hypothetical protein ACHHYP_16697 [Achlya hypogyna]|uniref:RanBP2-type domain-containing protein n=1 Tax=Achlya hypogyna TaxID=1202772 RepID=A0A1V9Y616_ACHHY|nr:hypothetical protein ACHHYP_16697 [Achlya hypogyna]
MNRQRQPRQGPKPKHASKAGQRHTVNSNIRPGMSVAVVQKLDQPTGRLTYGTVAQTLTNSALHHRGIKVRLTDGTVGRVQHIVDADFVPPTEEPEPSPPNRLRLQDFINVPPPPKLLLHEFIEPLAPPTTGEVDARPWPCAVCTFVNSGFLVVCEMCETPK